MSAIGDDVRRNGGSIARQSGGIGTGSSPWAGTNAHTHTTEKRWDDQSVVPLFCITLT